MKALYIYNPHSAQEVAQIERATTEMLNIVDQVEAIDVDTAKQHFHIHSTPALIVIRDDLQGTHLLDEVNGQLRITAELYKAMEEEDLNLHQAETHRLDNLINIEVTNAIDNYTLELIDGGVI